MSKPARIVTALLTVLVLSVALAVVGRSAHTVAYQTLHAMFNADGSMRLSLADGTAAGSPTPPGPAIAPGAYLVVADNSSAASTLGSTHRFHLTGPGVDVEAVLTQEEEEQANWTVTFQTNATYVFQDDYRPGLIHLVFHTSSSAPTVLAANPVPAATLSGTGKTTVVTSRNSDVVGASLEHLPFRGTLVATVSGSGALTMRAKGKAVTSLTSGRYTVVITDRSAKSAFRIQESRKNAKTLSGTGYTGRRSLTLELTPGEWLFFATFVGKKSYFIVHG